MFVVSHVPAREPGCVAFEYSEGNAFFTNIFDIFFINVYNTITFSKSAFDFMKKKKTIYILANTIYIFCKEQQLLILHLFEESRALNVLNQIKQMPKHLEAVHRPPQTFT